jgi:hypothetical protein
MMKWERYGRKQSWPVLRYYLRISGDEKPQSPYWTHQTKEVITTTEKGNYFSLYRTHGVKNVRGLHKTLMGHRWVENPWSKLSRSYLILNQS